MKRLAILVYLCIVPCPCVAGSISGSVKGSDGSIISAGSVTASRRTGAPAPRLARTSARAVIGQDGSFQLPLLADGEYQICAHAPATMWLDSCEWGSKGATVSLEPTQPSANISIVLTKGVEIQLRVNDPASLLAAHEGKTPGAHLLVGVNNGNLFFRPAAIISSDASGRTYRVLVPFDRTVQISIASAFFQVSDLTGRALPKFGTLIPALVKSGQPPPTLLLNLTGANKP